MNDAQSRFVKKTKVKVFCNELLATLKVFDISQNNEESCTDINDIEEVNSSNFDSESSVKFRLQDAILSFMKVKRSLPNNYSSLILNELVIAEQTGKRGHFLEIVYQFLLTIPPTSVEAERVFSSAGLLCTKLRSHLSDVTLDCLSFLRSHLKTK